MDLMNVLITSQYLQKNGSGGGSGIIDVTELPETGAEGSIYRLVEKTGPVVYLSLTEDGKTSIKMTLDELISMVTGVSIPVTVEVVPVLPDDMVVSDDVLQTGTGSMHIYVLEDTGIGYIKSLSDENSITETIGHALTGMEGFDKGWVNSTDDMGISDDIEAGGEFPYVYILRGGTKTLGLYIYTNNTWLKYIPDGLEIIGVSELPTDNIDTSALYLLMEEAIPDVYVCGENYDSVMKLEDAIKQLATGFGGVALVSYFYVDELPQDMFPSIIDDKSIGLNLYILKSDGVVWMNDPDKGIIMFGDSVDYHGYIDSIADIDPAIDGIYTIRGKEYITGIYTYFNNKWIEYTNTTDVTKLPENGDPNTVYRVVEETELNVYLCAESPDGRLTLSLKDYFEMTGQPYTPIITVVDALPEHLDVDEAAMTMECCILESTGVCYGPGGGDPQGPIVPLSTDMLSGCVDGGWAENGLEGIVYTEIPTIYSIRADTKTVGVYTRVHDSGSWHGVPKLPTEPSIIEVTELPTENIDKNAVYKLLEITDPEVYAAVDEDGGFCIPLRDMIGQVSVNTYVVDTINQDDMIMSDVSDTSPAPCLHIYILESTGVGYIFGDILGDGMLSTMPLGEIWGAQEGGWKDNTDDMAIISGSTVLYTLRGSTQLVGLYIYSDNEWMAYTEYVEPKYIEVAELPTENIQEDRVYGLVTAEVWASLEEGNELSSVLVPVHVVEEIPPTTQLVENHYYVVLESGNPYWAVVADEIGLTTVQMGANGWVDTLDGLETGTGFYALRSYTFYKYINEEWIEYSSGGDSGGGEDALAMLINDTLTEYTSEEVTSVRASVFSQATSLQKVDLPNAKRIGGSAFSYSGLLEVNLPRVEIIDSAAFQNTKLQTISLPIVTKMGNSCFSNCSQLTNVSMPCLTSLESYAFSTCSKLKSVYFPEVTVVKSSCLANTLIEILDLPKITRIESTGLTNMTVLKALVIRNTESICGVTSTNSLNYTPIASGTGYIYVPSALVDSYKSATNWSPFAAQIRALEDYTVDGTLTGALDETKI